MPWYDYQCEKCGAVFEVLRSMDDDSKVKCHHCGSSRTVKIYAAAPIVFKGSGFYVNDSGKKTSSTLASSNGESGAQEPGEPAIPVAEGASKPKPKKKSA
jgi:putative FmdB family regulatory protein